MSSSLADEIVRRFADRGGDRYGERVSQLDHALQCALQAHDDGAEDHLVVAALLHDFGHLLEGGGDETSNASDKRHEVHGVRALGRWFGPDVTGPIALHVAAKRYLCAAEPGYLQSLSVASVRSLGLQGGPFRPTQCRRFEKARFAEEAVRLRRWDDRAKVDGAAAPALETYLPLLDRVAIRPATTSVTGPSRSFQES